MQGPFVTPRDLLAIDPVNPARIPTRVICERLGVNANRARALRQLAARAPQVLERNHPASRGTGGAHFIPPAERGARE